MAAGTGTSSVPSHVIGSTVVELSRNSRTGAPFSVRISTRNNGVSTRDEREPPLSSLSEGPSCIFVGPIETASKETLEALYRQARDAYYSGNPLIVDDMFDRVELKLRWYGSKYVVKYPRCSLRRQSTYADAEIEWHGCRAGRSFTGLCISKCVAFDIWLWQFSMFHAHNLHYWSSLSRCFQFRIIILQQPSICNGVPYHIEQDSFYGTGGCDWLSNRISFC